MIIGVKKFTDVKYYIPRGRVLFRDKSDRRRINASLTKKPSLPKRSDTELINLLADAFEIDVSLREDFAVAVNGIAIEFRKQQARAMLPDLPERDYRAREDLFSYLRSDEGFAPWIAAGLLSRPLIREKAPKAYVALANWLRADKPIPGDLDIPTKSDLVDRKIALLGSNADIIALARSVETRIRREP